MHKKSHKGYSVPHKGGGKGAYKGYEAHDKAICNPKGPSHVTGVQQGKDVAKQPVKGA